MNTYPKKCCHFNIHKNTAKGKQNTEYVDKTSMVYIKVNGVPEVSKVLCIKNIAELQKKTNES